MSVTSQQGAMTCQSQIELMGSSQVQWIESSRVRWIELSHALHACIGAPGLLGLGTKDGCLRSKNSAIAAAQMSSSNSSLLQTKEEPPYRISGEEPNPLE
jgi:hypothetical protein